MTDGDTDGYRGSLFYDLAKASVIRLAVAQTEDLRAHGVAAVALAREYGFTDVDGSVPDWGTWFREHVAG